MHQYGWAVLCILNLSIVYLFLKKTVSTKLKRRKKVYTYVLQNYCRLCLCLFHFQQKNWFFPKTVVCIVCNGTSVGRQAISHLLQSNICASLDMSIVESNRIDGFHSTITHTHTHIRTYGHLYRDRSFARNHSPTY